MLSARTRFGTNNSVADDFRRHRAQHDNTAHWTTMPNCNDKSVLLITTFRCVVFQRDEIVLSNSSISILIVQLNFVIDSPQHNTNSMGRVIGHAWCQENNNYFPRKSSNDAAMDYMCLVFSLRFMLTYTIRFFLLTEMQNCQKNRSLDLATEVVHKSTNKMTVLPMLFRFCLRNIRVPCWSKKF